jgi:hypothetical protein
MERGSVVHNAPTSMIKVLTEATIFWDVTPLQPGKFRPSIIQQGGSKVNRVRVRITLQLTVKSVGLSWCRVPSRTQELSVLLKSHSRPQMMTNLLLIYIAL